jgi:hypothetical protein
MVNRASVSFEVALKSVYHVEVISLSGKVVYSSYPVILDVGKHEIGLNIENLTKGVYFIRLIRDNQILESIKVVAR